ncbi:MAG TPA: protein kinase [Candidatus Eisenbacteria bacterium]|nr:protein kinase [Candidatus Eisenbacteria bacterium]
MIGERLSHYRIESRLGRGGMGEVFLARDLALGRDAAIKVLPPEFDPELRRRLLREAETSRRLQHPGIATFYETGDAGDTAFIAMEYVRGETLRARLRDGALPAAEAVGIASALLEALGHAHAAGVVHRDIKPENIMIGAGAATKLLDFGLAHHAPLRDSDAVATITALSEIRTEVGAVLGTIGYMAPEQLRGETVDVRADLFAVGAVLFEMLTGAPAFPGTTPVARIAATMSGHVGAMPWVADDLRAVVHRALAAAREDRFQTAAEFLRALRRLSDAADGAGGAEGAGAGGPPGQPETLAVLDFETRSTDPSDSWIGAGIAESLLADLSRVGGLRLVPRARVLRAAAEVAGGDPVAIGARLGCRWVLSGSCQRMGPSLRVFMQVTHAPTEEVAATEKLDGRLDDIFEMQDRLSGRAAEALRLGAPGRDATERGAPALGAYEYSTRGRQAWMTLTKGGFDRAEEFYLEAIRLEPAYPDALTGLAAVHDMRFTFTTDRGELEKARAFAGRAIELAPGHADAHVWLGYALWRLNGAEDPIPILRRASELSPENNYPSYFQGCVVSSRGDFAGAVPHFQRAVERGPGFGFAWVGLGTAHLELGNLDEASWSFAKGVEIEQSGVHATAGGAGYLGECLRRRGRLEEARTRSLAGLDAAERSDHMYRDTFRATCLNALGRTALDQGDRDAALAAFRQSELHLGGRPRTLAGGWLACQAMAGVAAALGREGGGEEVLRRARDLFETRRPYDWSWFFLADQTITAADLVRAADSLK